MWGKALLDGSMSGLVDGDIFAGSLDAEKREVFRRLGTDAIILPGNPLGWFSDEAGFMVDVVGVREAFCTNRKGICECPSRCQSFSTRAAAYERRERR